MELGRGLRPRAGAGVSLKGVRTADASAGAGEVGGPWAVCGRLRSWYLSSGVRRDRVQLRGSLVRKRPSVERREVVVAFQTQRGLGKGRLSNFGHILLGYFF